MERRYMFEVPFLFNKGSLNETIRTRAPTDRIIATHHEKYSFGFAGIAESALVDFVSTNKSCYEVLVDYPKKVYFDIDSENPKEDDLAVATQIIRDYLGDIRLAVSGSQTATKNSYHITCPDLIIEDVLHLSQLLKMVKQMKIKFHGFDTKVYTKNRLMKCINQSKKDGRIQSIIQDDNISNHFIGSFFTGLEQRGIFKIPDSENVEFVNMKPLLNQPRLCLPKEFIIDNAEMKELLFLAPMNSSTHHGHTWQGCRFARHNNISFDTFWEWAKQKVDTIERKAKWQKYWMDSKLFTLTKQGWIGYLTFFYPELSLYNPNMRPETLTHTTRTIESLNVPSFEVPSLCQALFKSKHRVIIFGTGMGSGKTTHTTKYAQAKQFFKPDLNTLWICPRKTLAINTHARFDRVNCINYMDVANLKNKVELLRNAKTLLITLESLHYLEEQDLAKFDNMVVDEFETELGALTQETTHCKGKYLGVNYLRFKQALCGIKKVILMDAFTTTKSTKFLINIGIPKTDIIIFTTPKKQMPREIHEILGYQKTIDNIINDIKSGLKVYVFHSYRNGSDNRLSIEDLGSQIREKTGKRVLVYTSDTDDTQKKALGNVALEWSHVSCVLSTSCISVGVNYELTDYDRVYGMIEPAFTSVREFIQSSMRLRHLSHNMIFIHLFSHQAPFISKIPDFYHTADTAYKELFDTYCEEKHSEFEPLFMEFCKRTNYHCESLSKKKHFEQFNNILHKSKMSIAYADLPEIDEENKDRIETERVWAGNATMADKLAIQKWYFDQKHSTLTTQQKEYVWDNKLDSYFDNIYSPFIALIKEQTNTTNLSDIDIDSISKNPIIKEYIQKHFNLACKYNTQAFVKALNLQLGITAISSKEDKNKNITYEISNSLLELEFINTKPECLIDA